MQVKKTVTLHGKVVSETVYNTVTGPGQTVKLIGTDMYLPNASIGASFTTAPGKVITWTKQ